MSRLAFALGAVTSLLLVAAALALTKWWNK